MEIMADFIIFVSGTSIGGILGYLLKIQVEHRLALTRIVEGIRITEYNKAAADLRAAFAPAVAVLHFGAIAKKQGVTHEPLPGIDSVDSYLLRSVLDHAAAIEKFRPFVPVSHREEYQKTWDEYRRIAGDKHYGTFVVEYTGHDNPPEFIASKIHAILKFAEKIL